MTSRKQRRIRQAWMAAGTVALVAGVAGCDAPMPTEVGLVAPDTLESRVEGGPVVQTQSDGDRCFLIGGQIICY